MAGDLGLEPRTFGSGVRDRAFARSATKYHRLLFVTVKAMAYLPVSCYGVLQKHTAIRHVYGHLMDTYMDTYFEPLSASSFDLCTSLDLKQKYFLKVSFDRLGYCTTFQS
jgi:hypothetical protein